MIDARQVIARRTARGWNQSELGRQADIPPNVISAIERGATASPRLTTSEKLARAFGCSIEDLMLPAEAFAEVGLLGNGNGDQPKPKSKKPPALKEVPGVFLPNWGTIPGPRLRSRGVVTLPAEFLAGIPELNPDVLIVVELALGSLMPEAQVGDFLIVHTGMSWTPGAYHLFYTAFAPEAPILARVRLRQDRAEWHDHETGRRVSESLNALRLRGVVVKRYHAAEDMLP